MAAETLDVGALEASSTASEAEVAIPNLDAAPDTEAPAVEGPAVETDSVADDAKTENTIEKPTDAAKVVTDAVAAFTPKEIAAKLSEMKKTDPALATRLHQEVKHSLESKRFLQSVGAKDFAEAKTLLSKPDEATENFRQSVEETDSMLYAGGEQHATLVNNILEDLTSELGEKEGPARLSELSENIIEKLKTADPAGATRIQRAQFLAASKDSGLIQGLNDLHTLLADGKTSEAQGLLKSIAKFFNDELKADGEITKTRTEAKAAEAKETTATVTKLKAETEISVDKSMNQILGGQLSPFLKNQLKGVSRPELESLASAIKQKAKLELGRNQAYVAEVSKGYGEMKTTAQKDKLIQKFEAVLKKDDFGKKLVERICREKFPEKFAVKPAVPKAPASTKVTIGGRPQTVFQLAKRPTNLVRSDVGVAGHVYTAKALEMLQIAKGIGVVPSKSTGKYVFVQWKR